MRYLTGSNQIGIQQIAAFIVPFPLDFERLRLILQTPSGPGVSSQFLPIPSAQKRGQWQDNSVQR
jgi:hypothetical protein